MCVFFSACVKRFTSFNVARHVCGLWTVGRHKRWLVVADRCVVVHMPDDDASGEGMIDRKSCRPSI